MRNFNEVYEKLYAEKNEKLELLRKQKASKMLMVIIVTIIVAIIGIVTLSSFGFAVVFLACVIAIITTVRISNKYNYTGAFKKEVIETFIKECDSNLNFYPERGISSNIYRQGEFESYDNYYSEDLIEGILDERYKVEMSEVRTEDESTDSDGDTTTTTVFHGIFGRVECAKQIPGFIKIHSDKGLLGNLFGKKNKIEMDSSEFEKHFDVYTLNPIMTMQILTSDIMEMLIEFKEKSKIKYEITLKGANMYIRFHTGGVFEPKLFGQSLDFDTLKKYYDIIEFIFRVTRAVNKVIAETEI